MSLQNITITSSINSIVTQSYGQTTYVASTDEQSFPIESITGSQAGVWPNFPLRNLTSTNSASNYTTDLVVNITQSWSGSVPSTLGYINFVHNTMDEFFNGEFSGSNPYIVSDGNLTDEYCQQFLTPNADSFKYSIFFYSSSTYLPVYNYSNTIPKDGEMYIFYDILSPTTANVKSAKIARIDKDGNDLGFTFSTLGINNKIIWYDGGSVEVELPIQSRNSLSNYFSFDFISNVITIPFIDTNYLDYTFEATSSVPELTSSIEGIEYYFTFGNGQWNVTTDSANGWNSFEERYYFPMSPNIPIQFTASLDLTLNYPVTFSWAIQEWEPSTAIAVGNVPNTVGVGSYPNFDPDYFINPSNWVYYGAGNHVLTITGSSLLPIQDYAFEIDAFIKTYPLPIWSNQNFDNPPTGSDGDRGGFTTMFDNLPLPYKSWARTGPNQFRRDYQQVSPPINDYPSFINKGITGFAINDYPYFYDFPTDVGVWLYEPYSSPEKEGLDCLLTYWSASSDVWSHPSDTGVSFNILVEIPSPAPDYTSGDLTPSQVQYCEDYQNGIYGPSWGSDVYVVATRQGNNSSIDLIQTSSIIGVIPSQSSGIFEFQYTVTANDYKIGILAPASSSISTDYLNNSGSALTPIASQFSNVFGWQFGVTRFIVTPNASASINNFTWNITQSVPPQSVTSSFIFEPYLPAAFYNTDCDVLMNNYNENDTSNLVQEVLYDNGGIIPSNLQQIISGTAQQAEVNDYLFKVNASILPRYQGVRTTSPDFNKPFVDGFSQKELSEILGANNSQTTTLVSGSGNSLFNAASYCNWFAYFNYIEPTVYYISDPANKVPKVCYYISLVSLISINGDVINLSAINNQSSSGSIYSGTYDLFTGISTDVSPLNLPNPLTSNIPFIQSIFPDNTPGNIIMFTGPAAPPGGGLSTTGSFLPFNTLIAGYSPANPLTDVTPVLNYYYGRRYNMLYPNETSMLVIPTQPPSSPTSLLPTSEDFPLQGLLVPDNFNPEYKNNLLSIAQSVGFFKSV